MAAMGPCQNCGQELLFWVELKVAPVGTPQKCTPFPPSSSGRESIPAAHPSRPRERSRSRPRSDRKTGGRGRQQALPNNAGLHCVGSRVHGMTGQTVTNRDSVGDAAWGTIVRDGNLVTTNNFRVAPAPEAEVPITGATAAPSGPVADQRLEIAAQGFDVVSTPVLVSCPTPICGQRLAEEVLHQQLVARQAIFEICVDDFAAHRGGLGLRHRC